ncbi:HBR174Cp [Eremothecium sinecaudum]|uniref:Pre-mRNA-splicing factor 38 n=1 Tax=Eremothecium sinecaudum TaxID=45286 RepID=A0A125RE06_9SACH|nr:HBR174Cp [Eremothecium sinecaudum]AMD19075.1 HBR174Cp [Eremothecium sinecaudum]
MPQEFHIQSNISDKQLNHQSTSLVIPQITRLRIHSSMYYKIKLDRRSLRGDTMKQVLKVLVNDFGRCYDQSASMINVCGNVEFKCMLMKIIEICPTWAQVCEILQLGSELHKQYLFNDKYIVALLLVYLRIQYYYLPDSKSDERGALQDVDSTGKITTRKIKAIYKNFLCDFRKLKSINFEVDCWSSSMQKNVCIYHLDEIIDRLCTEDNIWGVPLGKCQWAANIIEDESGSEFEDESDISDVENSSAVANVNNYDSSSN